MDEFNINLSGSNGVQKKKDKKEKEFEFNEEVSLFTPSPLATLPKGSCPLAASLRGQGWGEGFDGIEIAGADVKPPEPGKVFEIPVKGKESEFVSSLNKEDKELFIRAMDFVLKSAEKELNNAKKKNGAVSGGWNLFKNLTGMEFGSDNIQDRINKLKIQVEQVKEGKLSLTSLYKEVTGNELNEKEIANILNSRDFSNAKSLQDVQGFKEGQKLSAETIPAISSALASFGINAATGGTAGLIQLFSAAFLGYIAPSSIEHASDNDGYTKEEIKQDLAKGTASGIVNASGIKAFNAAKPILGAQIMGTGNAVSNQAIDQLLKDGKLDIGALTETAAVTGIAAFAAMYTAANVSNVIRPLLTKGNEMLPNILGRLASSAASGAAAGSAASASAGSAKYIIDKLNNGEEIKISELINAAASNIPEGAVMGAGFGAVFEGIQIAGGIKAPKGAVRYEDIKTDEGIKTRNYYDKDGNIIASDMKAKDILTFMQEKTGIDVFKESSETALTEYNEVQKFDARTVRMTYKTAFMPDGTKITVKMPELCSWSDKSMPAGRPSIIIDKTGINTADTNSNNLFKGVKALPEGSKPERADAAANALNKLHAAKPKFNLQFFGAGETDEAHAAAQAQQQEKNVLKFNSDFIRNNPLLAEISSKILNNPNLCNNEMNFLLVRSTRNPLQKELVLKILDNTDLYNNNFFMQNAESILEYVYIPEQAEIADKIFNSPDLYNNEKILRLICNINNPLSKEIALKILNNPDLYNNKIVMQNAGFLLNNLNSSEQSTLAAKILSTPDLYNNDTVMQNACNIIGNAETPEQYEIAAKILNNPVLYNNETIMKYADSILAEAETSRYKELLYKMLDKPDLYNNKYTAGIIKESIDSYSTEIAEKIFNNPDLYNNDIVMRNADFLIHLSFITAQSQEILKILDNKNLDELNTFCALNAAKEITENPDVINKIADKIAIGLPASSSKPLIYLYNYILSDLFSLSFEEKINCINAASQLQNEIENYNILTEKEIEEIENFSQKLIKSLKHAITPYNAAKKDIKSMMKSAFANNNEYLETFISSFNFAKYEKQGIPLSYSRKDFLADLTDILKNIPENQADDIFKKLEIIPIKNENGEITGYDGIINLCSLKNEGVEDRVLKASEKFIKENKAETGDAELDNFINSLLKGMPEFINIIGKQQHGGQTYSLDIHILTVLKEAIKNSEYKNLSNIDKTCLKFAVIMHDIAKREDIKDETHPQASALYARNIMEKYSFPDAIKDRIFELIKNHHWLEEYSSSRSAEEIAAAARHKDDFTIAKIMAEADLKGVSDSFYNEFEAALEPEKLMPVANTLEKINQSGQLVFTSRIIKPNLIPEIEYKGKKYKVINFTAMNDDEDLSQYGFAHGTTKQSARFYTHMTRNAQNLETVDILSDIANGGFLCASYISPQKRATYCGFSFGVSLEAENVNVANAAERNQGSGCHKDFKRFAKIITDNDNTSIHRQNIPSFIKRTLNLTNEEYSMLYQLIASKEHITQIRDDFTYEIGNRKLAGREIKEAAKAAADTLISGEQNESNLYNPKINAFIAKVNSIEEIPQEYLDFIQKYNLPVYLLGK